MSPTLNVNLKRFAIPCKHCFWYYRFTMFQILSLINQSFIPTPIFHDNNSLLEMLGFVIYMYIYIVHLITSLSGTNSILQNSSHSFWMWEIFCWVMSVPLNTIINLNDVMLFNRSVTRKVTTSDIKYHMTLKTIFSVLLCNKNME